MGTHAPFSFSPDFGGGIWVGGSVMLTQPLPHVPAATVFLLGHRRSNSDNALLIQSYLASFFIAAVIS